MNFPDLAALARAAQPEDLPALLGRLAEAIVRLRLSTAAVPACTNGHARQETNVNAVQL